MKAMATVLLFTAVACAQARPEQGGHELSLWTGGGPSVANRFNDDGVWNVNLRYGWVLTRPHGPGILSGRFEYAVDATPLYLVFQRTTVYGGGFTPAVLKWNFATRGRIVPFGEIQGGVLFTKSDVPAGTSSVNFTPGASAGVHILREKNNISFSVRYGHISNAGLSRYNPGINTVQFTVGIGRFTNGESHKKKP
ncbi:MAG TPA: acyloxyacyl hydrolase [Terriglobales bacterium]|nr:acyloxyacyl hydrolase [Terriglobales bacterium]